MPTESKKMQQRRATAADWTAVLPTLASGEIGFETDTGQFKIGNGTDNWTTLDYAGGGAEAPLILTAPTASDIPLTLKLATSQTANAFEVNSSSGSGGDLVKVDANGILTLEQKVSYQSGLLIKHGSQNPFGFFIDFGTSGGGVCAFRQNSTNFNVDFSGNANTSGGFEISGYSKQGYALFDILSTTVPVLLLRPDTATKVPLQLKLAASQSANAFEINSSSGSGGDKFKIDATGTAFAYPSTAFYDGLCFSSVGMPTSGLCISGSAVSVKVAGVVEFAIWQVGGQFMSMRRDNHLVWNTSNTGALDAGYDIGLARGGAGILKLTDGSTGGGVLESIEVTAPASAPTNGYRMYAEDNGSGKTRLMVKFQSGAAVQIAIEP